MTTKKAYGTTEETLPRQFVIDRGNTSITVEVEIVRIEKHDFWIDPSDKDTMTLGAHIDDILFDVLSNGGRIGKLSFDLSRLPYKAKNQ